MHERNRPFQMGKTVVSAKRYNKNIAQKGLILI